MRKASRSPSEWLKLLCRNWAAENMDIVEASDLKFLSYKSYLKGQLSSQLLCRLSIPDPNEDATPVDFWKILGVEDNFDKAYIVAQIERFCALYAIRGALLDEDLLDQNIMDPTATIGTASTGLSVNSTIQNYHVNESTGIEYENGLIKSPILLKSPNDAVNKEISQQNGERRDGKQREREAANVRKAADRAAKEATREERRQKKLLLRQQREKFAQEQKNAALNRAAELVRSNRVPIEITRGAVAAQAAANAAVAMMGVTTTLEKDQDRKKSRSAIVVSTANDLHQIVTHSKNLWTKYNAIAKEHNQKVNWATVAKELGIHVKVREKYARMYARAEQRGFDFNTCGHFKIKDHPGIFLEPIANDKLKQLETQTHHHVTISDDQVAAAVDAAIKTVPVHQQDCSEYDDAAAAATAVDAAMKMNGDTVSVHGAPAVGLSVTDAAAAALAAAPDLKEHEI